MILICMIMPSAFAGKVELTTYYLSPMGEYKNLSATEDASFATTKGSVIIGTDNPTNPAIDNTLTLKPVSGNAGAQTGGIAGSLRFSADALGTGIGGVLYRDASGWQSLGGKGANIETGSYVGTGLIGTARSFTIPGVSAARRIKYLQILTGYPTGWGNNVFWKTDKMPSNNYYIGGWNMGAGYRNAPESITFTDSGFTISCSDATGCSNINGGPIGGVFYPYFWIAYY